MLHLERKGKGRPPSISLRENSRLFTPNFIKALSVALGIHLAGILIFQIHPFFIRNSPSPFPPVQVNIEMLLPNSAIFAELQGERAPQTAIPEPHWATPDLPPLTAAVLNRLPAYPKTNPFPEDSFTALAEWRCAPGFPQAKAAIESSAALVISGPLAERMVATPKDPKLLIDRSLFVNQAALYAVKVDDPTGKIIWHDCKTPKLKKKLRLHAEEILDEIQFVPLSSGFLVEGVVEIRGGT